VIGKSLAAAAHLLYWLRLKGRGIADIDDATIGRFLDRHLPSCRCARKCLRTRTPVRQALARWLSVLRARGSIARPPRSTTELEAELARFERHLIEVCGLSASSRYTLLRHVRGFLLNRFGTRHIDFAAIRPTDVRHFIAQRSAHLQPISLRPILSSLHSYFRFRALSGARIQILCASIPRVTRWSLANLPQTLAPEQIERLLRAFDRTRPGGQRDYAVARCVADLGLRPIEVSRLRLEDVHWDEGTLHIHGKGRRVHVLPLPSKLGTALAQYLRHARPRTSIRSLFVPLHAPLNRPITSGALWRALSVAACRAGLREQFKGARMLRHSVATELARRRTPLKTIADLLRHRSLNTTTIYAKVDLPALTQVALPWPGNWS
jgi:site-specific recombinase XerD